MEMSGSLACRIGGYPDTANDASIMKPIASVFIQGKRSLTVRLFHLVTPIALVAFTVSHAVADKENPIVAEVRRRAGATT